MLGDHANDKSDKNITVTDIHNTFLRPILQHIKIQSIYFRDTCKNGDQKSVSTSVVGDISVVSVVGVSDGFQTITSILY